MTQRRLRSDDPRGAEIAALRAQGSRLRVAAERLGLSPSRVHQLLLETPLTDAQAAAVERFPGFPRELAAALDARYPDATALAAASAVCSVEGAANPIRHPAIARLQSSMITVSHGLAARSASSRTHTSSWV
jgi:hypothetical protein